MDNTAFEINMINAVNENAKTANEERIARLKEELATLIERKKAKKFRAVVEVICWVLSFATTVYAMGVLNLLGEIPNVVAIIVPALFGLIAGVRIRGLFNVI